MTLGAFGKVKRRDPIKRAPAVTPPNRRVDPIRAVLGVDPGRLPGFVVLSPTREILYFGTGAPDLGAFGPLIVVIERPEIRANDQTHPEIIVRHAWTAGMLAGRLATRSDVLTLVTVHPKDWKGRIVKDVMTNRILRAFPSLKGCSSDVIDAAGIAAWYLGVNWERKCDV